jgi:stress-induced morphogen
MAMPPDEIRCLLKGALPDAEIELIDLTGTADHYECHIASMRFVGVSPMAQHKLVYQALAEPLRGPIHAFSIKTYTPALWRERKPS